jgi:hypothetical protein
MTSPDSVLATVGLESILRGEPRRYTKAAAEEAAGIPRAIKTALTDLLTNDFERAAKLPPFKYDDVNDLLTASGTPEQIEALQKALGDPALAADVTDAATRAIQYLNTQLPRRVRETLTGSDVVPPSGQDLAQFRRAWLVATDPMIVLRDLKEGALSKDMVATLATVYPDLYAEIRRQVTERLIAMKAKRKTWTPSRAKEQQLAVLMQIDSGDAADMAQIQSFYASPQNPQNPGKAAPSKLNLDTEDLETPGQRAEN